MFEDLVVWSRKSGCIRGYAEEDLDLGNATKRKIRMSDKRNQKKNNSYYHYRGGEFGKSLAVMRVDSFISLFIQHYH